MNKNEWKIIFCSDCGEPTPPISGMKTDFGFLCDDCINERETPFPPPRNFREPEHHI